MAAIVRLGRRFQGWLTVEKTIADKHSGWLIQFDIFDFFDTDTDTAADTNTDADFDNHSGFEIFVMQLIMLFMMIYISRTML